MGGDFNEITCASEKFGERLINNNRMDKFLNCISHCNLMDLGFSGSRYTWSKTSMGSTTLF